MHTKVLSTESAGKYIHTTLKVDQSEGYTVEMMMMTRDEARKVVWTRTGDKEERQGEKAKFGDKNQEMKTGDKDRR